MALEFDHASYFDGDHAYLEGIEELGIEWGSDRVWPGAAPAALASGIKGRRGNPTEAQMIATNGQGIPVQATDQVWSLYRSTFVSGVAPRQGDILFVVIDYGLGGFTAVERWMVKWAKQVLYGAQYLCYCAESPLNEDVIHFQPPAEVVEVPATAWLTSDGTAPWLTFDGAEFWETTDA